MAEKRKNFSMKMKEEKRSLEPEIHSFHYFILKNVDSWFY